jgi:hypothetical protein
MGGGRPPTIARKECEVLGASAGALTGHRLRHEAFRFRVLAMRDFAFMTVRNAWAPTSLAIRMRALADGVGSASTRRAGKRLTGHAAFSQTHPGIIPRSNRNRSLNSKTPPHCGQHFVSPFTGR